MVGPGVAEDGPVFDTDSVVSTVVVTVLAVAVGALFAEADAVFDSEPVAMGATWATMERFAVPVKSPSVQVTVSPVAPQLHPGADAVDVDTNVVPDGRASVTVASMASGEPVLATVMP